LEGQMPAHKKPTKFLPLAAAVLFLLVTAAVGGYALAGNDATKLADSHPRRQ